MAILRTAPKLRAELPQMKEFVAESGAFLLAARSE
jgi:hypothetical protein